MSAKMWRSRSPRALLLGCKMVLQLWKAACLLLKSAQIELSSRVSLSFLLCFPQCSVCGPPDFGRTHSLSCIKISNFQASGGWWGAGRSVSESECPSGGGGVRPFWEEKPLPNSSSVFAFVFVLIPAFLKDQSPDLFIFQEKSESSKFRC